MITWLTGRGMSSVYGLCIINESEFKGPLADMIWVESSGFKIRPLGGFFSGATLSEQ